MSKRLIHVVGGGFAGVEAAWACAQRGVQVRLYEMRPDRKTGAHCTSLLAELVCSNSFKSKSPTSPSGQLKCEMEALGSLVLQIAKLYEVPAGEALAVDRTLFAEEITRQIDSNPNIEVIRLHIGPNELEEMRKTGPVIIATGPLTSGELAQYLASVSGSQGLYFYDAVSPTVEASSLNYDRVFAASRYGKGGGSDYLNCPFNREEYFSFVYALVNAERALPHGVSAEEETLEKIQYFAGCMPIEAIAEKGENSLAFGNFKPVGLTDPRTGRRPFAALQLRPENKEKTLYTLVACQNRLKWGEQKRVFQLVPGLENSEFVRYGVIHRNTYLNAPKVMMSNLELKSLRGVFIAGQLTGVEGYLESAAMGILAGISATGTISEVPTLTPPRSSAFGSLLSHLQDDTERDFAPMNINWGLFPTPKLPFKDKQQKKLLQLTAAQEEFRNWSTTVQKSTESILLS